ncbi:hypothetical protein Tco_1480274, partial [Tanacetum coccineum]
VMAAIIISISSEESVGSRAPRVILFGAIPAIILVIPEVPVVPVDPIVAPDVGIVSVISPVGVLDLLDYSSSSDSYPSEDSLPPIPDLSLVSPFLCSDDSEVDDESEPAEQRPVSPSHDTLAPSSEFPLAPVVAPAGIRRRPAILFTFRSFLIRTYTTDVDTSTPPRFVHRSHDRTPRRSEAFRRWRSAPLSTPYPPTTSESSLGSSSEMSLDSSSPSFRPSRKRCRSPTASIPSPTHDSRSIAPTLANILPPRKRFRDSYSPEDNGEEHMEVKTADAEAVTDVGISDGVVADTEDGVGMRVKVTASDVREDDEEFEVEANVVDTREIVIDLLVPVDRITEIETAQRRLEAGQLITSGERVGLSDNIMSLRIENLKVRAMLSIERDRIDSIHWHMAFSQEEFCQVRRDRDDARRRLRRLESFVERRLGFRP